jgi:hypothetical protein
MPILLRALHALFLLVVMFTSFAALSFLPARFPTTVRNLTQIVFLGLGMLCGYDLLRMCFVYQLSSERMRLLVSASLNKKRRAIIGFLSCAFGARYGNPSLLSRKQNDLCFELWQKWWEQNKDQLAWCSELGIWVERSVLANVTKNVVNEEMQVESTDSQQES